MVSKLFSSKPPTAQGSASEHAQQQPGSSKRASVPEWYETLGVASGASTSEMRRAYQTLMGQYHPDKVAALGPELRDLAERKSKEINLAYRNGMRARGADA